MLAMIPTYSIGFFGGGLRLLTLRIVWLDGDKTNVQ